MARSTSSLLAILVVVIGASRGVAQFKPEVIERGKKATALVQTGVLWSGSAFCLDKSGLFVTTAHVLEGAIDKKVPIEVVLEGGLETERKFRVKLLRRDDKLDLALLQVDTSLKAQDLKDVGSFAHALTQSREVTGLTPLTLGKDSDLLELAEIVTLGYPSRPLPPNGRVEYPPVTVLRNHITALRKDKGQLLGIQVDSQLNPRSSGGPVLDASGQVIGVVAATVRGAAMNLAIPVGRLTDFLAAPGIVFDPPALNSEDRTRPVTWTIQLQPPRTQAQLPEGLSVAVTLEDAPGKSRSFTAEPAGAGVYKVTLNPRPSNAERGVELVARFRSRGPTVTIQTQDREVKVGGDTTLRLRSRDRNIKIGGKTFKLSDLRVIFGGAAPRAETVGNQKVSGQIEGLGKAQTRSGQGITTLDLRDAAEITISMYDLPLDEIVAVVEAKQGSKVLATVRQRAKFTVTPTQLARTDSNVVRPRPAPDGSQSSADDGVLKLSGALDVDGVPRGAGKDIQPPRIALPDARLTPATQGAAEAPLVRRLNGRISDVAVGGGGRFLLLTLADARKLAVFDVTVADIVTTVPLASPNALVAAGAKKFLVALPDEKRIERWDLATLQREGDSRPSPVDGPIKALAMGSDSDGPALALWFGEARAFGFINRTRGSFIDLDTLAVLKFDPVALGGSRGPLSVSVSGSSVGLDSVLTERPHLRASAGGGLFGIWQSHGTPSWFFTLAAHGQSLVKVAAQQHFGYVAPGPDGRTVFTCAGGRLYADNRLLGRAEAPGSEWLKEPELVLPSADPTYYLSINGLPSITANNTFGPSHAVVTVSVRAAGDGSRLLTVHGLDEMAGADSSETFIKNDFTIDKRFHLVPSAHMFITIPPENDRLVLRRLNLDEVLAREGRDFLIMTSTPCLLASAGQSLEHRVAARSRKGGLAYALASGPDGLEVSADGTLTWSVPRRLPSDEVRAVVTARDATGQEIFQTLLIHVKGADIPRPTPPPAPGADLPPSDEGLLKLGGTLQVSGVPLGAGQSIQPARIPIPAARLTPGTGQPSEAPLVRRFEGTIGDVAVGGGGRFLLVALKDVRKLAVLDVNAADVVKTLPLPSTNALIAAGAKKLLIAFPEEKLIERWDLSSLQREAGPSPSPIDGWIKALALGSDSDGPALALWYPAARGYSTYLKNSRRYLGAPEARFSFIDLDKLTVRKSGSITLGKPSSLTASDSLSASGGSFMLNPDLGQRRGEKAYIRPCASGALYGIGSLTNGLMILKAHGKTLEATSGNGASGYFAPSVDGRMFYCGLGDRRDAKANIIGQVDGSVAMAKREPTIPSADPSYYLSIGGLPENVAGTQSLGNIEGVTSPPGAVTASVHAAGDGSRLLTVHGLDEMALRVKMTAWFYDDMTIDKRFYFVPAARLLITIPPSNDRLVLRRLDLDQTLDRAGGNRLIILSSPTLTAAAGSMLEHRIVTRSKKSRITYTLADGPDGLKVAPDGKLTWAVPQRLKGEEVKVVITVGDSSGDELFHTLKISVE